MNNLITTAKTMSSREIAELTGSTHEAVKKSARRLEANNLLTSPLAESVFHSRGKPYQELSFNKRDSLVLVARLSPEFTAAIIDRWQELEQVQTPAIPQTYAAALLEAGRLAHLLEEQAPKIEYHDKVLAAPNGLTTSEIASELGMTAQKLNKLLKDLRIQKKIGQRWMLTACHLGQGLETEETFLDDGGVSRHSMKWTELGRKFIHDAVS
tara:strand:+ start:2638 stop:3270 length:633 start_codon:yes stop_codon:yes gene_type:complete